MKKSIIRHTYVITAVLCIALLMPLIVGCSLTIKPKSGVADSQKDDSGDPVNSDTDGKFAFTGSPYKTEYLIPGLPDALSSVQITADKTNNGYAAPDTAFTVRTASSIEADELRKYIHVTPSFSFDLKEKAENTFTVKPDSVLDSDALYRFTVGDLLRPQSGFVFQTDSALIIKSVLPADLALYVPVNTGIEITFSEPLAAGTDIENHFTVTPEVEGEYMTYPDGRTYVFVPRERLAENSVYSISVTGVMTSVSGKTLSADLKTSFRTSSETASENREVMFSLESYEPQFTTDETPVIKYYYSAWNRSDSYSLLDTKVTLYRYASAADIVEAMKLYESVKADYLWGGEAYIFPSEGLQEIGSYDIKPESMQGNRYQYNGYLTLPAVGEGAYLVNITFCSKVDGKENEFFCQAIMQISDLIVYTEASGDRMLVWVNDAKSDKTVESASVTAELFERSDYWNLSAEGAVPIYTKKTANTDKDGLCFIETNGLSNAYMLVGSEDHLVYVCAAAYNYADTRSWFSFLFTDRETYFSNDTVNLWGVIAPKNSGVKLPETLYLTLGTSKTAQKIAVLPDGSFSVSFDVEDFAGWGIYMNLTDSEGNTVTSKYINITQQSKPVYTAELTFDKLFYTFGDTVRLSLKAAFYDGTPAPGLEFTLYGNYFIQNTVTIKTDADGTASYSYKTVPHNFYSTWPAQLSAEAYLIGNEDTTLSAYANAPYFQSKTWLREKRVIEEDGSGSYSEILLNYFDTSVLKEKEDLEYPLFPENTLGNPAPGSVDVRLIETKYVKEYNSTSYDPITKTSQIQYTYRTEQKDVRNYKAQFSNGVIQLDHVVPEEGFNGYYTYEVSYYDADNKCNYLLNIYANAGEVGRYYYDDYKYYELKSDKTQYKTGETVTAVLHYGEQPVEGGRLLFTVYSDRLALVKATDKNSYSFIFEDSDAAGLAVLAAHFDGRRVQTPGYLYLSYDYADNVLNTEITADKTSYKPGETAKVTVTVTDAAGNPVTGGLVTLAVVDEACFALGVQNSDPLRDYYAGSGNVIPYIGRDTRFSCFGSHWGYPQTERMMYAASPALGTGEMNDMVKTEEAAPQASDGAGAQQAAVREIYRDNPLFETYAITRNGTAEITLAVPDNITEWRFTAVAAYNKDASKLTGMNMGSAKTGVVCTLPFFINVTVGDTCIEGDDIAGHARVYGSGVTQGDDVSYTVALTGSDDKPVKETDINAKAGEFARFNFGSVQNGSYHITVTAKSGTLSDGVKLPVEVVSSGIMVNVRREINPGEIAGLNPMMYPVSLNFTDTSYTGFFSLCRSLMRETNRSDALAAYYAAALISETLSGTRSYVNQKLEEIKATLSGYSGFIPLLAYSEGDVKLTAKICAVVPEALTEVKKEELAVLFSDYINNRSYADDADMCAAYLGLASLGQPVLADMKYIAENSAAFSTEAKLYLAAAFAYAGDYGPASEYYRYLMQFNSMMKENELSVRSSGTEESIKLTALALMTAAVVDKEGAGLMANYLATHISSVNLYDLERASYVRYYFPTEAKEASFTYSIGGKEETVTLHPGEYYNLSLDRRDFSSFALISADDTVTVYAAYRGAALEAYGVGGVTDELKITKTIDPYDTARGLYKVTLSYRAVTDRSYAFFSLSDCIPSGARCFGAPRYEDPEGNDSNVYTFAYIANNGTQVMEGYIGLFNRSEKAISGLSERVIEGSVSYLIRAAVEGGFVVENAVVQNVHTGSYSVSNRGYVTMGNGEWVFG